jgi:predicted Zn-dependent protease
MKKIIIQGLISVFLFLGIWFVLNQIDWLNIFKVQQLSNKTEQKLGDLFWDVYKKSEKEISNIYVVNSVDSIVSQICRSNKIDIDKLKIHVVKKDDINAFALPNGHLVIYTGLILNSDNQEELTGVICHEIAHIEQNHVNKKLVKEIGLSALISMTTGGGAEVIKETAKLLSSSSFDRSLEKEADIKAVDYLLNANVNPEPFANFLSKLSDTEDETTKYLTWISTHPDSKERAEYIIEYSKGKLKEFKPILSNETWARLKLELNN